MLNVNGIKRNAKNIVKKYSDAQVKVREATSNDPWGPSATIMAEIADLTYNVVAFSEIMQMIWKRLNDHGKNWRHVYKALVLLEYLIKTGSDKVAQQCTENIFAIQTLKDFQFMEENKDHGMNIREKSKKLVALLKDSEKLKAERARALKAKARLAESMSSVSKNSLGPMMSSSTNGEGPITSTTNGNDTYHNNNDSGSSSGYLQDASGSIVSPDLSSARPQSLTEEEQQLRLALALSKEEAEQQEKTRKNDELRLKLALDVSKKSAAPASSNLIDDFDLPSASSDNQSATMTSAVPLVSSTTVSAPPAQNKSAIDDLLGLSIPPPNEAQAINSSIASSLTLSAFTTDPPTLPISQINSTTFATSTIPSSVFPEPSNDPWSVDPWKVTSNSNGSTLSSITQASSTSTLRQTQPINMLPFLTSTSTMPQIPVVGTSNGSGFFDDASKRPMSKNPFQD